MKEYSYKETKSDIFGTVKRPLIIVKMFSPFKNTWIPIYDTLLDTGADISIIPKYIGNIILEDITKGKEVNIKGIVPDLRLIAYIHTVKIEVAKKQIEIPLAIANSDKVMPILGRVNGLDIFDVEFKKGKSVIFKE